MAEESKLAEKLKDSTKFSEEEMKAIKLKSFGEYSIVGQSKLPFDL